MKWVLLLFFLFFKPTIYAQPNTKPISIQCSFPKKIVPNKHIELIVNINNQLTQEQTGTITLELFNTATNTSIDGWFINIFPFQYFTAIPKQRFSTTFPITIPGNFKAGIKFVIKANCGKASDSLIYILK